MSIADKVWPNSRKGFNGGSLTHSPSGRMLLTGAMVPPDGSGEVFTALYSDDGTNWQVATTPQFMWAGIVIHDGSQFVGLTNNEVYTSADGSTWTHGGTLPLASTAQFTDGMAYGNGRYVVVGGGGLVASSSNAVDWTAGDVLHVPGDASTAIDLGRVIFVGGRFVAVGTQGAAATSTDGLTWTVTPSATTHDLHAVAASTQGQLVAVGEQGVAETSTDGVHWTLRDTSNTEWMMDVTFGNGAFLSVGDDGYMALSSN
jgi:hypothetical protein